MIILFWALQALLAAVLLVPSAIIVIGGSEGFSEFAEWIIGFFVVIGAASFLANVLRRRGSVGAGALVLFVALAPFLLLAWLFIAFTDNWHI